MIARRFAPGRPIAMTARLGGDAPLTFRWAGRRERVARIEHSWDVTDGWWRGGAGVIARRYYRLLTQTGLLCVIYRDLATGDWFLEQIVD